MDGCAGPAMPGSAPPARQVARCDWTPPDWLVDEAWLRLRLDPERTEVEARLALRRAGPPGSLLRLDGGGLVTRSLRLDGVAAPLPPPGATRVELAPAGARALLESRVEIAPARNPAGLGLHLCGSILLSQCEPEGFRRITWFPDRPDILVRTHVRLEALRARFPVLLSNGNPGASGDLGGGWHFAEWHDPWPKPCYLFALVAGRLACLEDRFVARSGRAVALRLWAGEREVGRGRHALESLRRALAFDEAAFGREPDLDCHNLVAVPGFAFGAMENKGLTILNARHVLAEPQTSTDADLARVSSVVAHEILHNWSGARVPIRDWFQLALKEGLTVWREQRFAESLGEGPVARLREVEQLDELQPAGAEGEEALPARPETFADARELHAPAVYGRGAEIVGMIARTVGEARFRRALARFFDRFDGRPVTIEDFLGCMAADGLDPAGLARWYGVPGTPFVVVHTRWDKARGEATLHLRQAMPRAGRKVPPLPIPLDIALWSPDGRLLAGPVLHLMRGRAETLRFPGVDAEPVAAVNRGLSAPVRVVADTGADALLVLARFERDAVIRWQALGALAAGCIRARLGGGLAAEEAGLGALLTDLLADGAADPAVVARLVALPPLRRLAAGVPALDPEALLDARNGLGEALAAPLAGRAAEVWRACLSAQQSLDPADAGRRALGNAALAWLVETGGAEALRAAMVQHACAAGLTGQLGALAALSHRESGQRAEAIAAFRRRHADAPHALDQLRAVLAAARRPGAVEEVAALAGELADCGAGADSVHALFSAFAQNLPALFRADGAGVRLLLDEAARHAADQPLLAAGLVRPLRAWPQLAPPLGQMVQRELARLGRRPGLPRELAREVERLLRCERW